MSAAIDRLRQIAAAWHRAVHVDSSMIPVHVCDLDAVLADVSAERTRASAAEAECARLTTERDAARRAATFAEMERDTLRGLTDAMRADNVRLRGIVESVRSARAVSAAAAERYTAAWDAVGTMPPTPAQSEEIAAALRASYEAQETLDAALTALLAGAPCGYVEARVVRAYLAAVEAFDGGALGAPCRASIRVDDTRAALVAALERCP